jgi:hypothetical protein
MLRTKAGVKRRGRCRRYVYVCICILYMYTIIMKTAVLYTRLTIRICRGALSRSDWSAAANNLERARGFYEEADCANAKQRYTAPICRMILIITSMLTQCICRALEDMHSEIEESRENAKMESLRSKLASARAVLEEQGPMTKPRILRARDVLTEARKVAATVKDTEAAEVCVCVYAYISNVNELLCRLCASYEGHGS